MLKRIGVIGAIVALLLAALAYSQLRPRPFRVSGHVEADEVRVGSRVGGRVAEVLCEEGQAVAAGDVLVRLDTYDLNERLAQARADLAGRQAALSELTAGYRVEEAEQARARRDRLAATLEKLVAGPRQQEIAAARARLDLARAQLDLAEIDLSRTKQAFEEGAASPNEVDRAVAAEKVAEATVRSRSEELDLLTAGTREEEIAEARANVAEADAELQRLENGYREEEIARAAAEVEAASAGVGVIERQIEELTIRAPIDAIVEAVDLVPGDLVAPNAPALALIDLSRLWVRAYVPENRLDISVGRPVQVSADSFPNERFDAYVGFIAREAEFTPSNIQTPEERSKQVFRIKVELTEGHDRLLPGMPADVWLDESGDK